jgi:hypothetical protein
MRRAVTSGQEAFKGYCETADSFERAMGEQQVMSLCTFFLSFNNVRLKFMFEI